MAHLARGSVIEASKLARNGLAIMREVEFAMRLPKVRGYSAGNT